MTIAAGFRVQDGILLCSDSLYTGGTRAYQQKLFGYLLNGNTPDMCTLAFALAGHENNGKMAIEECVDEVLDCPPEVRSLKKVKRALRKAVKSIYGEYVDCRPEAEKEASRFELIIGAWLPRGGGLKLFKSSGPAVLGADNYHCTGVGAYLGDYLMRDMAARNVPSMRMEDAALLSIRALTATKRYDAYCGGPTQFLRISNEGQLSNAVPYNIQDSETYVTEFEDAARRLLFKIGGIDDTDVGFDWQLESFVEEIKRIRKNWKSGNAPEFQRFMDRLHEFRPAAQSTPDTDHT